MLWLTPSEYLVILQGLEDEGLLLIRLWIQIHGHVAFIKIIVRLRPAAMYHHNQKTRQERERETNGKSAEIAKLANAEHDEEYMRVLLEQQAPYRTATRRFVTDCLRGLSGILTASDAFTVTDSFGGSRLELAQPIFH